MESADARIVERIWRTLKYEWIFLRDYRSEEELKKLLKDSGVEGATLQIFRN